jgi:hypothetical protein
MEVFCTVAISCWLSPDRGAGGRLCSALANICLRKSHESPGTSVARLGRSGDDGNALLLEATRSHPQETSMPNPASLALFRWPRF